MSDTNTVVSAEFNDFDAYVEAIEDVDAEMKILSLERNCWTVDGIYLPGGTHVQTVYEGGGSLALGAADPAEGCNIFAHCNGMMRANGEEIFPGSAFIVPPRCEFVLSIDHANRWYSIHIPASLSHDLGLNEVVLGRERRQPHVAQGHSPDSDPLWSQVSRFLSSNALGPEISRSTRALANFEHELIETIRASFGRQSELPRPRRGRPVVTDKVMVARAIDAIEASPDSGLAIENLVRATGVSERSLREGFRRYLGVSPKRYMQLHVLNRARRRLSLARPDETTVTQVAADLGQWDMGRFAMRYREAFGETPSATLQDVS